MHFTELELARYSGATPGTPIYVAVNGSVFDVSASPHIYGPGGGYHFFAGRDAARAYVSGCFKDDLTHDLRGLEDMFVTGKSRDEDNAEAAEIRELERKRRTDGLREEEKMRVEGRIRWLKGRREKRREDARLKVRKGLDHWDKFFRNHDRYFYVGEVKHEPLDGKPVWKLCDKGKAQQKPRS